MATHACARCRTSLAWRCAARAPARAPKNAWQRVAVLHTWGCTCLAVLYPVSLSCLTPFLILCMTWFSGWWHLVYGVNGRTACMSSLPTYLSSLSRRRPRRGARARSLSSSGFFGLAAHSYRTYSLISSGRGKYLSHAITDRWIWQTVCCHIAYRDDAACRWLARVRRARNAFCGAQKR